MKKSLSFLALLVVLSVAQLGFAADQQPSLGRVDSLSDLPSRASEWYSAQWQKNPVFTGIWTGFAVLATLYCVSDSFKGRVRTLWTTAHKAVFGDTKCSSCQKPQPKPKSSKDETASEGHHVVKAAR